MENDQRFEELIRTALLEQERVVHVPDRSTDRELVRHKLVPVSTARSGLGVLSALEGHAWSPAVVDLPLSLPTLRTRRRSLFSAVLMPGVAWAAPKIKSVFVQEPVSGAQAGVDATGRLRVGDGAGPLTVDGSVTAGGSVQEAQPADFYRTSDPIFANGAGCRQIAAAPAGKALIVKTIIVQQDVVNQAGQGYSIYRGTGCNDPNLSGVTGAPAVPGPTITLPFEPGLAVPSGRVLVVTQGNISSQFSVFGYTVAASACSSGCP